MKKYLSLLLTFALLLTLSVPAFAAVTDTFVDEIPADTANFLPQVVGFSSVGDDPNNSHKMAVENNPDLGATLLLKAAAPRDPKWSEYITYKMDKNIAGFEFDVVCCAGLGNPLEDISVFISKTGADDSWQQVKTQATKYVYNEDIYINFDKAYWHNSKLMNKSKIPTGYKYLKIQFNGCTEANDVPWNVGIDKVTIYMGTNVAAPTISADDKFETYEQINATRTTKGTESTTSTTASTQGTTAPSKTNTPSKTNGTTTASKTNAPSKTNGTTAPTKTNTPVKTTAPTKAPDVNNTTTPTQAPVNGTTAPTDAPIATNPGDSTTASDVVPGDTTASDVVPGDTTASEVVPGDTTTPTDPVDGDTTAPTDPVDGTPDENVSGDKDDNGSNAWIWIVVAVVVLAGAGVGVFFFLRKKTNS